MTLTCHRFQLPQITFIVSACKALRIQGLTRNNFLQMPKIVMLWSQLKDLETSSPRVSRKGLRRAQMNLQAFSHFLGRRLERQ